MNQATLNLRHHPASKLLIKFASGETVEQRLKGVAHRDHSLRVVGFASGVDLGAKTFAGRFVREGEFFEESRGLVGSVAFKRLDQDAGASPIAGEDCFARLDDRVNTVRLGDLDRTGRDPTPRRFGPSAARRGA